MNNLKTYNEFLNENSTDKMENFILKVLDKLSPKQIDKLKFLFVPYKDLSLNEIESIVKSKLKVTEEVEWKSEDEWWLKSDKKGKKKISEIDPYNEENWGEEVQPPPPLNVHHRHHYNPGFFRLAGRLIATLVISLFRFIGKMGWAAFVISIFLNLLNAMPELTFFNSTTVDGENWKITISLLLISVISKALYTIGKLLFRIDD